MKKQVIFLLSLAMVQRYVQGGFPRTLIDQKMLPPKEYGIIFANETGISVDVDIYWIENGCGTNRVTLAPYAQYVPASGTCTTREMWVLPTDRSLLETVGHDKSTRKLDPMSVKQRNTTAHAETKGVWVVTVVKEHGKLKFKIQSYW